METWVNWYHIADVLQWHFCNPYRCHFRQLSGLPCVGCRVCTAQLQVQMTVWMASPRVLPPACTLLGPGSWLHNHTTEFHLCFLHLPQLHESRWWNSLEKRSSLWERVHLVQETCSLTRLCHLTMGSIPRSEEYLAKEALQEGFTIALLLWSFC